MPLKCFVSLLYSGGNSRVFDDLKFMLGEVGEQTQIHHIIVAAFVNAYQSQTVIATYLHIVQVVDHLWKTKH